MALDVGDVGTGSPSRTLTCDGKMNINASAALPVTPQTTPHPFHARPELESAITVPTSFVLKCATANVLTLYQTKSAHGKGFTARHEALLRSVDDEGLHFVGIQETRSQMQGHSEHFGFHILSSPATLKGVGGIQLWVRKQWRTSRGMLTLTS